MSRTTEQWEALLDGTTEEPWVIGATLKDPLVDVSAGTYEDALLAAHAPAAVAEVVRLRRAFGEWATSLEGLSVEMETEGYRMNAEQVRSVVKGIRHILKGGNDE